MVLLTILGILSKWKEYKESHERGQGEKLIRKFFHQWPTEAGSGEHKVFGEVIDMPFFLRCR
jgi:hypothetical protein